MEAKRVIPVTVLTGFLGSGKTTLLNRILGENHGKKIAVIENEFGEVGVDNELVIGADEEIFEMNNGCICCTVRGDLIRILDQLTKRKDQLDYIIIETTGMANPAPVAQTFWVDDEMRERFSLDAIVTIVDSKHVWMHIEDSSECKEQIAFADVVLLNKTDLVTKEQLEKLEKRIKSMNSQAIIHKTKDAAIDLEHILNIKAFDLDAKAELNPEFLQEELPFEAISIYELDEAEYELQLEKGPDETMDALICQFNGDIDKLKKKSIITFADIPRTLKIDSFINTSGNLVELVMDKELNTFRIKPGKKGIYAFLTQHGPSEFNMKLVKSSNLVPKGISVEPVEVIEYAHSHEHDETVTSIGIEDESALSIQKVNDWISWLLQNKGTDIFRMKGILNIYENDERFVFQGVHMLFDAKADREWKPNERRRNQIIFIGKNLDREELMNGFKSCIVKKQKSYA